MVKPHAKKAESRARRRQMTPAEALLWERLRKKQLGARFHRHEVVAGERVDFCCFAADLVINLVPSVTHVPSVGHGSWMFTFWPGITLVTDLSSGHRTMWLSEAFVVEQPERVLEVIRQNIARETGPSPSGPPAPPSTVQNSDPF